MYVVGVSKCASVSTCDEMRESVFKSPWLCMLEGVSLGGGWVELSEAETTEASEQHI